MDSTDAKTQENADLLELTGRTPQGKGKLVLVNPFSIAAAVPQTDGSTKVMVENSDGYCFFVQESASEIQSKRRALLKASRG